MSFADELLPASFRGVPFGVLKTEGQFGRRLAAHEYPFRDQPYVEDLGRRGRRISLTGFLVQSRIYGGGDVLLQQAAMIAAAEAPGPGTLVHPTLGLMSVSCDGLAVSQGVEDGPYFELGFSFLESGQLLYPDLVVVAGAAVLSAALVLDQSASEDFQGRTGPALRFGTAVIGQGASTATIFAGITQGLARDATGLFSLDATLTGNFGRYFSGRNRGFQGSGNQAIRTATAGDLIVIATARRAAIATAAELLEEAARAGDSAAIASAAQALLAALLAATADPADAVRLLSELAAFQPNEATTGSVIGTAMATMQDAAGDLFRRAAVAALARAITDYQPSSADDAIRIRNLVTALLETEITVAGDQGEDASYNALRALRVAVATDLNDRGAALPRLRAFAFGASLPALMLANRIYRDAGRADELVTQADPPHPLFMPARFSALAS